MVNPFGVSPFIIDRSAPRGGAPAFDEGTEEAALLHKEETEGIIPDPGAREWKALTMPPFIANIQREDPPGTFRLCKNDLCSNIVSSSKVKNVKKLFCTPICARRYHTRAWSKRSRSASGQWLETKGAGEQIQFYRVRPRSGALAEAHYKAHLQPGMCPNATEETNRRCPAYAYQDFYSREKRCLIYATLVDDMKEKWAEERGERYIRQFTTFEGCWLEHTELDPKTGDLIVVRGNGKNNSELFSGTP